MLPLPITFSPDLTVCRALSASPFVEEEEEEEMNFIETHDSYKKL